MCLASKYFTLNFYTLLFLCFFFLSDFIFPQTGLILSGQPGHLKNKRHFLENGLDRALTLKRVYEKKSGKNKVLWIIFNSKFKFKGGCKDSLIREYVTKANYENIDVVIVNSRKKINRIIESFVSSTNKIRDFYYIGHAKLGELCPGYINEKFYSQPFRNRLKTDKWSSEAFCDSASINLVGGCRTAVPKFVNSLSAAGCMSHLTNGNIYASNVKVFYPGGPVSDLTLLKKNNGQIIIIQGKKSVSSKNNTRIKFD